MRAGNVRFDRLPLPQHKKANNLAGAIQIFGFLFFLTAGILALIFLKQAPQVRLFAAGAAFFLAAISLLAVYEGRVELARIDRIESILNGTRKSDRQYIEGTYKGENVGFYISSAPGICYTIQASGHAALPLKDTLNKFIAQELKQSGLPPHRLLISENVLVLSKVFLIAFQIQPEQTPLLYDILIRAKKEFGNTP